MEFSWVVAAIAGLLVTGRIVTGTMARLAVRNWARSTGHEIMLFRGVFRWWAVLGGFHLFRIFARDPQGAYRVGVVVWLPLRPKSERITVRWD